MLDICMLASFLLKIKMLDQMFQYVGTSSVCLDFVSCIAFLYVTFVWDHWRFYEDFIHVTCGPRDMCF